MLILFLISMLSQFNIYVNFIYVIIYYLPNYILKSVSNNIFQSKLLYLCVVIKTILDIIFFIHGVKHILQVI